MLPNEQKSGFQTFHIFKLPMRACGPAQVQVQVREEGLGGGQWAGPGTRGQVSLNWGNSCLEGGVGLKRRELRDIFPHLMDTPEKQHTTSGKANGHRCGACDGVAPAGKGSSGHVGHRPLLKAALPSTQPRDMRAQGCSLLIFQKYKPDLMGNHPVFKNIRNLLLF